MKFTKEKHTLSALGQKKTHAERWIFSRHRKTANLTVNNGSISSNLKKILCHYNFLLFTMLPETSQYVCD